MGFSPYNPHDRYRQRSAKRASGVIRFLFLFMLLFGSGFWLGGMRSQQNIYILKEEKRILSAANNTAQSDMIELRAEAQTANVRIEQMRTSYDELLSDGPVRDLLTLVRNQIEQGVDPQRLQSVVLSARPPQNCSDPESKRFVVMTPVYNGPSSVASINGGVVAIYGNGLSSQNIKGNKEAWFDPSKPISVIFKAKGEKSKTKKGVLPLHHSMIIKGKEYRFTITAGSKSFAKVTFDHCDYP